MGYEVIVGPNTFSSNNTGECTKTWRITIPASEISEDAEEIRLGFDYRSVTYRISKCYIGHQGTSNDEDFDGNQVQVTFDGGNASKDINASGLYSDDIAFSLDSSKDLVISFYWGSCTYDDIPYDSSGWTGYQYGFDTTGDSAADTHPTYFTGPFDGGNGIVKTIEKSVVDVELGIGFDLVADTDSPGITEGAGFGVTAEAEAEYFASADLDAELGITTERYLEISKEALLEAELGVEAEALNWSQWLAQNRERAVPRYYATLTGTADGLSDLEIPIESLQARLRSGEPTYLEVVVRDLETYLAPINARSNGDIKLEMAWDLGGEESVREVLCVVDLENIRTDIGSMNESITLSGHRTYSPPAKITRLSDVVYRSLNQGELHLRTAVPDMYLQPGDTAVYQTDDFNDVFTVDSITYIISATQQQMDVQE